METRLYAIKTWIQGKLTDFNYCEYTEEEADEELERLRSAAPDMMFKKCFVRYATTQKLSCRGDL